MAVTGAPLKTPATPKGILDLEFAHDAAKTLIVINNWSGKNAYNINAAKINTLLDFIFLFFYSLFLFNLCKILAEPFGDFLHTTGRILANGALAAGIFDVLENVGLLITLYGYISDAGCLFTFIFSLAKWITVTCVVLYILTAGPIVLFKKINIMNKPV